MKTWKPESAVCCCFLLACGLPFVRLIASKTGYLSFVLITFVANIVSSTIGAEKNGFFLIHTLFRPV